MQYLLAGRQIPRRSEPILPSQGNILALTSISVNTGVTVNGRVLARNGAVTLDTDTITPSACAAPPLTGSIKVVKNAVGGDGAFTFTSNFGLTSLTTISSTASQTFGNLTPGSSYSVSETVPSGWAQTSASCTNGTLAAITVVAGATTTCVITNTTGVPPPVGLITVVKNTVGGDDTFAFTGNFGLTSWHLTTSGGTASQTFGNVTPGSSYSVSETVPSGWIQTSASCTNGTPAAITVVAGVTTAHHYQHQGGRRSAQRDHQKEPLGKLPAGRCRGHLYPHGHQYRAGSDNRRG